MRFKSSSPACFLAAVFLLTSRISSAQPSNEAVHQRIRRELLTAEERDEIVNEHNNHRSKEGANAMEYMIWNDDIATLSDGWAKVCTFHHGHPQTVLKQQYASVGQNIYATSSNIGMGVAIQSWFNEKKDYDFDAITCSDNKMCGHYTQVVWGSSKEIGCAWANCDQIEGLGPQYTKILVCDYHPSGNLENTRPYTKGPECSQCESGKGWCFNGLCRADCNPSISGCECTFKKCHHGGELDEKNCKCKCTSKWMGNQCEERCEDKDKLCNGNPGYPTRYCTDPKYSKSITRLCPLMCGLCGKDSSDKDDGEDNGDNLYPRNRDNTTGKPSSSSSRVLSATALHLIVILHSVISLLSVFTAVSYWQGY